MTKLTFSISSCILVAVALAAGPKKATVASLLSDIKLDHQVVVVQGTVSSFRAGKQMKGKEYFLFKLQEGGKQVSVYGRGLLEKDPANGDRVVVTGQFSREVKAGTRTYKNEIVVMKSVDKTFGVRIIPKK